MAEGEVDDGVGGGSARPQDVEVVDRAAQHLGAERVDGRGRLVGAGQTDHLVAGGEELGDDGGADEAGRAGDEDTHGIPPGELMSGTVINASTVMSETVIT